MIIENENGYKQYVMPHWTPVEILSEIYEIKEKETDPATPEMCCASCQSPIPEGYGIRVCLEKFTHNARIFFACSEECEKVLH